MKFLVLFFVLSSANVFSKEVTIAPYIETQEALAADDFKKGLAGYAKICQAAGENCAKKFKDIDELRVSFKKISDYYIAQGNKTEIKSLVKVHCPMYPGSWLQRPGKIANPYYGKAMLECGEKVK